MKTILFSTMALALALGVPTRRAEAGSEERAFVAGVVGGALLHHAATRSPSRSHTRIVHTTHAPRRQVSRRAHVTRGPVVSHDTYVTSARTSSHVTKRVRTTRSYGRRAPRHEKVWVPGYREKYQRSCGTWVVRKVPGHYEVRPRRVYVESNSYRRRAPRRRVYTR